MVYFRDDELSALKSMSLYWDEIDRRDSAPPGYAQNEIFNVVGSIGYGKLLAIVHEAVKHAINGVDTEAA